MQYFAFNISFFVLNLICGINFFLYFNDWPRQNLFLFFNIIILLSFHREIHGYLYKAKVEECNPQIISSFHKLCAKEKSFRSNKLVILHLSLIYYHFHQRNGRSFVGWLKDRLISFECEGHIDKFKINLVVQILKQMVNKIDPILRINKK